MIGVVMPATCCTCLTVLANIFFNSVFIKGYHKPYWGGWSKEAVSGDRLRTFLALVVPTSLSSVVDWASGALAGSFSGLCGVQVAAGQNVLTGLFALTYSTV